jgi:uncharacterized OB-fold protein
MSVRRGPRLPARPLPARPAPGVEKDSVEWWAAVQRHELVIPRCDACGTWRWPPRAICGHCGSLGWSFVAASGRGTIASWIVNRHGFGGAFPLPSTAMLVRLAEQGDLLLPGGWAGADDGSDLEMGMEVRVGFEDVDEEMTILRWERAQ